MAVATIVSCLSAAAAAAAAATTVLLPVVAKGWTGGIVVKEVWKPKEELGAGDVFNTPNEGDCAVVQNDFSSFFWIVSDGTEKIDEDSVVVVVMDDTEE